VAASHENTLPNQLESDHLAVAQVHTGTLALEWARDLRPDTIIVESALPDMTGLELCRALHSDLRTDHYIPILIVAGERPTPEQSVEALRAGAWDFLMYPGDREEFSLKLQTYIQAKRNIDVALADGMTDPATGLHSRPGLARRARELGALMARKHGALSCVVVSLEPDYSKAPHALSRVIRVSDVVGSLGPGLYAVLAPATDQQGAIKLAQRITDSLAEGNGGGEHPVPGSSLWVGYEAVDNLRYSPVDPVELLSRAAAAARGGTPEPDVPWVRHFEGDPGVRARSSDPGVAGRGARPSPVETKLDRSDR